MVTKPDPIIRVPRPKKKKPWWKLISTSTLQAVGVLSLAIATAVIYNQQHSADPAVAALIRGVCQQGFCHSALQPSRRTQAATRDITKGQTVLEVPRNLQIWDVDALQDPRIRNQFRSIWLPDPAPALLAAYLAQLRHQLLVVGEPTGLDPLLDDYLRVLPSHEDHPVLWSDDELLELLGRESSVYEIVRDLQGRIALEYQAMARAAPTWEVSELAYTEARLSVMTRSFGTGPVEVDTDWDVDLSKGCHAMVPILDQYDHHANPNVGFHYDPHKEAFVVSAVRTIQAGSEVMDQYGRHTDSHLFAKYGFVNGDGSGHTQAGLHLWHRVILSELSPEAMESIRKHQSKQMSRYLQYDNGYEHCIGPEDVESWEFKKLKHAFLAQRANKASWWIVRMPPINPASSPSSATTIPITRTVPRVDLSLVRFDDVALAACRLIELTERDYNGSASDLLTTNMSNDSYSLPPQPRTPLEYRALFCVARMAATALSRYGESVDHLRRRLGDLNHERFGSRDWGAAVVRLGEMQTLEALKQVAFRDLQQQFADIDPESLPEYHMRNDPCTSTAGA